RIRKAHFKWMRIHKAHFNWRRIHKAHFNSSSPSKEAYHANHCNKLSLLVTWSHWRLLSSISPHRWSDMVHSSQKEITAI
ncbi:hypothetical protein LSAT2_000244, partial [Lamellibrachia satsuma]